MGTICQSLLQSSTFIKPNIPLSEKKNTQKVHGCLSSQNTTEQKNNQKPNHCNGILMLWQDFLHMADNVYFLLPCYIDSKIAIINMYNFMGKKLNNTIQCIHWVRSCSTSDV